MTAASRRARAESLVAPKLAFAVTPTGLDPFFRVKGDAYTLDNGRPGGDGAYGAGPLLSS